MEPFHVSDTWILMNVENPIILGSSPCNALQVVSCGAIWSNSHMKVNTRIHNHICPVEKAAGSQLTSKCNVVQQQQPGSIMHRYTKYPNKTNVALRKAFRLRTTILNPFLQIAHITLSAGSLIFSRQIKQRVDSRNLFWWDMANTVLLPECHAAIILSSGFNCRPITHF